MLLNDFFHIADLKHDGAEINATLTINAAHRVFDGHFPGQPVVPGVCMLQIVKELAEAALQKKSSLVAAQELKFLAIIDPGKNNIISARLKYTHEPGSGIMVIATLYKDDLVHFKFKGQFVLS